MEKHVALEIIRSITIGNFTATFRTNLISPVEDGKHIYFKFPNIWIPCATKRGLAQVYELRDKIDVHKRRLDNKYTGKTQVVKLAEL